MSQDGLNMEWSQLEGFARGMRTKTFWTTPIAAKQIILTNPTFICVPTAAVGAPR